MAAADSTPLGYHTLRAVVRDLEQLQGDCPTCRGRIRYPPPSYTGGANDRIAYCRHCLELARIIAAIQQLGPEHFKRDNIIKVAAIKRPIR